MIWGHSSYTPTHENEYNPQKIIFLCRTKHFFQEPTAYTAFILMILIRNYVLRTTSILEFLKLSSIWYILRDFFRFFSESNLIYLLYIIGFFYHFTLTIPKYLLYASANGSNWVIRLTKPFPESGKRSWKPRVMGGKGNCCCNLCRFALLLLEHLERIDVRCGHLLRDRFSLVPAEAERTRPETVSFSPFPFPFPFPERVQPVWLWAGG